MKSIRVFLFACSTGTLLAGCHKQQVVVCDRCEEQVEAVPPAGTTAQAQSRPPMEEQVMMEKIPLKSGEAWSLQQALKATPSEGHVVITNDNGVLVSHPVPQAMPKGPGPRLFIDDKKVEVTPEALSVLKARKGP